MFDIAIVGAGPSGLAAGLACAASGLRTAIIGPPADRHDGRTAALLDGSINLLKRLGVWDALAPASEPLTGIRLVDATGALLRAPEVFFQASEIGLSAFGYNIPNTALTSVFRAACGSAGITLVNATAADFELGADAARLVTSDGDTLSARLVVAADGRDSAARAAAGIEVTRWSYPQVAIVSTFAHSRPHRGVSTELHRHVGPLTVVPAPGNTSNLVWVDAPEEASRLLALSDEDFTRELTARLGGLLGTLSDLASRSGYPLRGQRALALARNRVALIGETAHIMPPIGAQGLNLSLRDGATLAEIAGEAKAAGQDIGAEAVLQRYQRLRMTDVRSHVGAVDLLNRLLLSTVPGVHFARGLGLFALAVSRELRACVMREGVMPSYVNPALMRPLGGVDEVHAHA
jgi:2-octaprenyl-6-methoxyphenol hydroxylase